MEARVKPGAAPPATHSEEIDLGTRGTPQSFVALAWPAASHLSATSSPRVRIPSGREYQVLHKADLLLEAL